MSSGDAAGELERLPGVVAATVLAGPSGGPRVYLATTEHADPDPLRAAAAALLLVHGLDVPETSIQVRRVPIPSPRSALAGAGLEGLEVHRREGRVECAVRLRTASGATHGRATEPDTASGRARAAARAALLAAEALDAGYRFGLVGVRPLDLFGQDSVVALVDASVGRRRAQLAGVGLLERSLEDAAVAAALAALGGWRDQP